MFKDFITAVYKFDSYDRLYNNKLGKAVIYSLVLVLITSVVFVYVPFFVMGTKTVNVIWEDMPEFTLTEDGLSVDKDFMVEFGGMKLAATNNTQYSPEDFGDNITGLLFDSDSVTVRSFINTIELDYSELDVDNKGFRYTKQDLMALKPHLITISLLSVGIMYVMSVIGYLFDALIVAAIINIMTAIMRMKIPFGKRYILSLYAKTFPFLLESVFMMLKINTSVIMSYAITIYIVYAYLRTKRDEFTQTQI